jgi:hypothetical protein
MRRVKTAAFFARGRATSSDLRRLLETDAAWPFLDDAVAEQRQAFWHVIIVLRCTTTFSSLYHDKNTVVLSQLLE